MTELSQIAIFYPKEIHSGVPTIFPKNLTELTKIKQTRPQQTFLAQKVFPIFTIFTPEIFRLTILP